MAMAGSSNGVGHRTSFEELKQRIDQMEKKWSDFGYPVINITMNVHVNLGSEGADTETPPWKKVKVEANEGSNTNSESTAAAENELTSFVLEDLSKRIDLLEAQWQTMFSDVKLEITRDSKENGTVSEMSNSKVDHGVSVLAMTVNEQVLMHLTERLNAVEKLWSGYFKIQDDQQSRTVTADAIKVESETHVSGTTTNDVNKGNTNASDSDKNSSGHGHPEDQAHFVQVYQCKLCTDAFRNFKDLPNHLRTSHSLSTKRLFECLSCRMVFLAKDAFNKHSNDTHGSNCKFCEFRTGKGCTLKQLASHLRSHVFKNCETCSQTEKNAGMSVAALDELVAHLTEHHGTSENPGFKCLKCQLLFANQAEEAQHILMEHYELKCWLCEGKKRNKVFKSEDGLRSHISQVHKIFKPKNSTCAICSEVIVPLMGFVNHVLKHESTNESSQTNSN